MKRYIIYLSNNPNPIEILCEISEGERLMKALYSSYSSESKASKLRLKRINGTYLFLKSSEIVAVSEEKYL